MPRLYQVLRQQARTTTDLEDETVAIANGVEDLQDPGRDRVGVKAEALMMNACKVGSEVRDVRHEDHRGTAAIARDRRSPLAAFNERLETSDHKSSPATFCLCTPAASLRCSRC